MIPPGLLTGPALDAVCDFIELRHRLNHPDGAVLWDSILEHRGHGYRHGLPRAYVPSEKIRPWLVYDLLNHSIVGSVLSDNPKKLEPLISWMRDPCVATKQNCTIFQLDQVWIPDPRSGISERLYNMVWINLNLLREAVGTILGYAVIFKNEATATHAIKLARRYSLLCSLTPHLPPVGLML